MRERHVLGGDAIRLIALLAERQRDVARGRADLLEVEHFRIPVGGLLEVRAGVGDVVDELRLERRLRLRGGAAGRIGRGGGERQRLDEAPAADLAGLELVELLSNKPFHDGLPHCPRRNASSSTMLANWTS